MAEVKIDHKVPAFQEHYAVEVFHSSRLCRTAAIFSRRKVSFRNTVGITVIIVANRFGQCGAACFISFAKR